MLCYKNHRFHVNGASFQIPDGYFLDTEPEDIAQDCVSLWGPEKDFSVSVRVDTNSRGAENELAFILNGMEPTILRPAAPITHNGLSGYHASYRNDRIQYHEIWFDVADGVTMLILFITKGSILSIDTAAALVSIDARLDREA